MEKEDWIGVFDKLFDKINRRCEMQKNMINEDPIPKFNSIEEARRYYHSIPFSEWLNKAKKKYNI